MSNYDIAMGTGAIGFDGTANEGFTFDTNGIITVGSSSELDLNNNNIRMGTGLIGFDGTASEGLSFDTNGNVTFEAATGSFILPLQNDQTTPTLAFGDGDTGIYEAIDDTCYFSFAGSATYEMSASWFRVGTSSNTPAMMNEGATATTPIFTNASDLDTGIGMAGADQLSLIAGGVEMARFVEDATKFSMHLPETATPTAVANYGAIYPKTDNVLYFQDGAGTEHTVIDSGGTITTGGSGSAGSGNQYVEMRVGANTYKVLHDGTV